jgi:hypothetical protein
MAYDKKQINVFCFCSIFVFRCCAQYYSIPLCAIPLFTIAQYMFVVSLHEPMAGTYHTCTYCQCYNLVSRMPKIKGGGIQRAQQPG